MMLSVPNPAPTTRLLNYGILELFRLNHTNLSARPRIASTGLAGHVLTEPVPGFSQYMSGDRYSSASSHCSSGNPALDRQAEINDWIIQEFRRATFLVDLTAKGTPLQADENNAQKVLNHLWDHFSITQATLLGDGNSTEDAPRFPLDGFTTKGNSYGPLTHFLNISVRAADECSRTPSQMSST